MVAPVEDSLRATPAPSGTDAHLTFANNRRSPALPSA